MTQHSPEQELSATLLAALFGDGSLDTAANEVVGHLADSRTAALPTEPSAASHEPCAETESAPLPHSPERIRGLPAVSLQADQPSLSGVEREYPPTSPWQVLAWIPPTEGELVDAAQVSDLVDDLLPKACSKGHTWAPGPSLNDPLPEWMGWTTDPFAETEDDLLTDPLAEADRILQRAGVGTGHDLRAVLANLDVDLRTIPLLCRCLPGLAPAWDRLGHLVVDALQRTGTGLIESPGVG